MQKGSQISPVFFPGLPAVHHPSKGTFEVVLFCKRPEVFSIGGVVLVVEIPAAGSRQAGGSAHYHAVSFPDLLYQPIDLFAIRQRLFVGQLIRRAAGSIDRVVLTVIPLGLHDQVLIKLHCHHSFLLGVIFILTTNYLNTYLRFCQYAVIIKLTPKRKGNRAMKYPTRLSDAVHILAFIALYPDCDMTSNKLAESVQTNPAYVRQLMSALRRGGLLVSVKGHPRPALAREPEKITLLDAYRAVEGNKPLLHQDIHTNPACGVGVNIQLVLRDFYLDIQKTAEQRMEEITLKNVLEQYRIRLEGIQRDGDCGCPGNLSQNTGHEA